jgi:hypothetical protein
VKAPVAKVVPVKKAAPAKPPVRRSARRGATKISEEEAKNFRKSMEPDDNNNNISVKKTPVKKTLVKKTLVKKTPVKKNYVSVEWTDTGGYSKRGSKGIGAYVYTDEFTINGSYYLEREDIARTNDVNPRVDLIYKYAKAVVGDYTVRAPKADDPFLVGDKVNEIWLTNSSKENTYAVDGDDIILTYQGTTYTIKPPKYSKKDENKKYFLRKSPSKKVPLTFIWLEPKAKAESFKDKEGKRKRLQNRVQITYDSMSEDDIAEIERAMQHYDDKLEKTLSDYDSESDMSPQAYDSSSAVSNSKASYDSSSDVSMDKVSYDSSSDVSYDKASYDSQSDVDKVQRSMYDSSSEVASETEMDYSYDSSSGVDEESDSNVPYDSDN